MSEVVVIGVAYPGVEPFLRDYFESLAQQTFKAFQLVLAVDGPVAVDDYLPSGLSCQTVPLSGTPATLRKQLLEWIRRENCSYVISTDCDDVFSEDRVENSVALLKYCDVVVNDVDVIDEQGDVIHGEYLSNQLVDGVMIYQEDLVHRNFMGLTNTAWRRDVIPDLAGLPEHVVAFDWYLFTRMLVEGAKACFSASGRSGYRVYPGNIAGLPQPNTSAVVMRGLTIKVQHYQALGSICGESYKALYEAYAKVLRQASNTEWFNGYLEALNCYEITAPVWWENIRLPREVSYANSIDK